ncbi:hypothetical protein SDC9_79070 [bioreactor metagenome]|uniref:Uncharacterized protein n=1 Tax=bioreactor metagenome TaxID=1076179 RepID=A0A644YVX3_9ZZZZ
MPSRRPRKTESGVRSSWAISANSWRRSLSFCSRAAVISLKCSTRAERSSLPFFMVMRVERSPFETFSAAAITSAIGFTTRRVSKIPMTTARMARKIATSATGYNAAMERRKGCGRSRRSRTTQPTTFPFTSIVLVG